MTFGGKIQALRKQQGLSQEALAEMVNVTRQTISKWELEQSTPDLEFIARLSDIFGVTTDYLIKGVEPETAGSKQRKKIPAGRDRRIALVVWSAAALVAVFVCLVCDYFIFDEMCWSFVAALSIFAAWCVSLPWLTDVSRRIFKTLLVLSIIAVSFLALLALLIGRPIVFTLGACVSLVAIAAVWAIYAVFCKCHRIWRALGFALLIVIPTAIAINHIAACFVQTYGAERTSDIFNSGITLIAAAVCFGIDYVTLHRAEEGAE